MVLHNSSEKDKILNQMRDRYTSAAILFHPFVQVNRSTNAFEKDGELYPSTKEILTNTLRCRWQSINEYLRFNSFDELELGLKSSNGSLNKNYANFDFANRLERKLPKNIFLPNSDQISEYILQDIFDYFIKKDKERFFWKDPLTGNSGFRNTKGLDLDSIYNCFLSEMFIEDENKEFALLSVYDSFYTILYSSEDKIDEILNTINVDYKKCDNETTDHWYITNN
ncbi:MAG: DUF2711 family protein [Clostridiales bacterium]|nr:DUF2711 family protein [Clostridiales bacterium]